MTDVLRYRPGEMARKLMEFALPLLDQAGECDAAALLQHAISVINGEEIPSSN